MFYDDTSHISGNDNIDTFDKNTSIVEDDSSRKDALGDLLDPSGMTLDDFMKEWKLVDSGLECVPDKFKWNFEDRGWGKNRISGDASETILNKTGEREETIISIFGVDFYNYCHRLFDQSIIGSEEMGAWFKDHDTLEVVEMRAEGLDCARMALQWYSMKLSINDFIHFQPKLGEQARGMHKFFKANKDKRWGSLKNLIIEHALAARHDTETINPNDINACLDACCSFLGIRDASWMLKKFVYNLFWGVIKSKPEPKAAALIVKWANSLSIAKTLENNGDYTAKIDEGW